MVASGTLFDALEAGSDLVVQSVARGLEARELAVLLDCLWNQQTSGFAAESGLDVLPLTLFSLETLPKVRPASV